MFPFCCSRQRFACVTKTCKMYEFKEKLLLRNGCPGIKNDPTDVTCHVFLASVFQADTGAGNPSWLLLLLRLWETQRWDCSFSLGQVSFRTALNTHTHTHALINTQNPAALKFLCSSSVSHPSAFSNHPSQSVPGRKMGHSADSRHFNPFINRRCAIMDLSCENANEIWYMRD